ncbi:MAG: ATP-dependent RNA helicase ddx51 [Trizodia sp. TS-e1964]|nr:MAG: ATP-dependent RNA helicase ddx51 [Trizodia sp. TS-e1964]
MTSAFYSRFIPPVKADTLVIASPATTHNRALESQKRKRESASTHNKEAIDTPASSPKRQKNKPDPALENKQKKRKQSSAALVEAETIVPESKKPKKKKPSSLANEDKRQQSDQSPKEPRARQNGKLLKNPESQSLVKHKTVISKFEKSKTLAGKKAKMTAEDPDTAMSDTSPALEDPNQSHALVPFPQNSEDLDLIANLSISALPYWLANPLKVSSTDTLSLQDLKIDKDLVKHLSDKGYKRAFAVQSAVMPLLSLGPNRHDGDICISASTGSGKTLSYVLPVVESLRDRVVTQIRALIIVPTRELVSQVREVCELCITGTNLQIGIAAGNRTMKADRSALISRSRKYDPVAWRESIEPNLYGYNPEADNYDYMMPHSHVVDHQSKVDILICTPGRLVDHIKTTPGFNLEHLKWLVIDEADRLLSQSFQQWTDILMETLEFKKPFPRLGPDQKILHQMGHALERNRARKIVLSATMTKDVGKLSKLRLRWPKLVVVDNTDGGKSSKDLEGQGKPDEIFELPESLKEYALPVGDGSEKPLYLLHLLQKKILPDFGKAEAISSSDENSDEDSDSEPDSESNSSEDSHNISSSAASSSPALSPKTQKAKISSAALPITHGVLIFTRSNESATRLSRLLELTYPALSSTTHTLTSSIPRSQRRKTLSLFAAQKVHVLVASDLVARGLDIQNLAHVVNYDLPASVIGYVHRVGRTARAGRLGEAWSLVTEREAGWFWHQIARGEQVRRAPEEKVQRVNVPKAELSGEKKKEYEEALEKLGNEVKGKDKE